jgi:hypothetical protein
MDWNISVLEEDNIASIHAPVYRETRPTGVSMNGRITFNPDFGIRNQNLRKSTAFRKKCAGKYRHKTLLV